MEVVVVLYGIAVVLLGLTAIAKDDLKGSL
jgi:hypothetical protein